MMGTAVDSIEHAQFIVDDIIDSGATAARYEAMGKKVWALVNKREESQLAGAWVEFPWEQADESAGPEDNVTRLLEFIGEDPNREGLFRTPERVCKALREMTAGYRQDPKVILGTTFDGEGYDQMVVLRDIEVSSMCEHHMLPFYGKAVVAYIPGERVVGLSKLARLVDCYAHRLQIQERLTRQIAEALNQHLTPLGYGVVIRAHHMCMSCRGVRKLNTDMVTSALGGLMKTDASARSEFMGLALL
jgi:GTP cyclohydrolase I